MSEAMKAKGIKLSLRYKLLAVLTVLPLLSLTAYLLMATRLFEADKVAYVFDSSVAASRSLANQIQVEFDAYLNAVKPVVERYDYQERKFSHLAHELFNKQNRVEMLQIYQKDITNNYVLLGELSQAANGTQLLESSFIRSLQIRIPEEQIVFERFKDSTHQLVVGYRIGDKEEANHLLLVSLYRSKDLVEAFISGSLYKSFLISASGHASIAPDSVGPNLEGEDLKSLITPLFESQTPEGTAEIINSRGQPLLLSYSKMNLGKLSIVSLVDKDEALRAVDMMVSKSILFFIALLSGTILISVFASVSLTSTLRELYEATKKIGQGDFDVRVTSRSQDEVGGLAESFNWMAGEVARLLSETAQKARMENELATVKTVQETLFPQSENSFETFDIVGHFEPASECGGDWWNYSKVGNKLYLWIGDATGHGAPAALITSAARSAAAIIEFLPEMSTSKALEIMNKAIYQTSKGKIMMTFFLGCIDLETNVLTYSNASHDPPYLLRKKAGEKLKKKDLLPLMDEVGPRLGDKPDSVYNEVKVELSPGDTLMFYTDGVMDLHNAAGEAWGERQFVRTLMKAVDEGENAQDKMQILRAEIKNYREESSLIDDVTLFMCEYRKSS